VCKAHSEHAFPRGVWGHAPPEKFLKIGTIRLNLVALFAVCIINLKLYGKLISWQLLLLLIDMYSILFTCIKMLFHSNAN